jgi:hypothetical protein
MIPLLYEMKEKFEHEKCLEALMKKLRNASIV